MSTKKRKSTGKRLRFEIFKRDGFRCIYCGATAVQAVLHIDHVIPVAAGGKTVHENLVTACADCNSGKSSISLSDKKLTKPMVSEANKEHTEQIKEYLKIQEEIAAARKDVAHSILDHWEKRIGPMSNDMFNRLVGLVREWSYEQLITAVDITANRMGQPDLEYSSIRASNQAMYFHGVLRNWRKEQRDGKG